MIQDICNMSPKEVKKLNLFDYLAAQHYAVQTYHLRMTREVKGASNNQGSETIQFQQEEDFDMDPNFVSDVSGNVEWPNQKQNK